MSPEENAIQQAAAQIPVENIPAPEEPQVQQAQEQTAPAVEAPSQEVAPEAPAEPQAPAETSTTSEVVEDDSTDDNWQPPQWEPQPIDINQLPRDPENPDYVDPQAYAQAITQQAAQAAREQARQEFAEQRREEQLWQKATEKYPQLKENADLRNLVHNSRMGEILTGKNPSPTQIADKLFKHLGTAKQEGVAQAQTNVQIQENARLETSNTRSSTDTTDRSSLLSGVRSYDAHTRDASVDALLKDMFDKGDLQRPM